MSNHKGVEIQKEIASLTSVTTPASKSGKVNNHTNSLPHLEDNSSLSKNNREGNIIKPPSKMASSPQADKSNQARAEFQKEVISHSTAKSSTPKSEKVYLQYKNQIISSPSVFKKNDKVTQNTKKSRSYTTNSNAQCIDINNDDLVLNFKTIKSDKPTGVADSAVKDSHSDSNGCTWLNKFSKLSNSSPPISSAAKRRKLNKTSLNILHEFILDTSSGDEEDPLNRKDVSLIKLTPSKPKLSACSKVVGSSPKTVSTSANISSNSYKNSVSSPNNSIYHPKAVEATSETSTPSLNKTSPRSLQKCQPLKLAGDKTRNDSQSNNGKFSFTTGTPKNKKRQFKLVDDTVSEDSVSRVQQPVTARAHTNQTPVKSDSLETRCG